MDSTSKCVDGAWTANLECQAKGAGCSGKPTNIAHATITCKDEDKMVDDATKYYDGTLCKFVCEAGYVAYTAGKPNEWVAAGVDKPIQCENAVWTDNNCQQGRCCSKKIKVAQMNLCSKYSKNKILCRGLRYYLVN